MNLYILGQKIDEEIVAKYGLKELTRAPFTMEIVSQSETAKVTSTVDIQVPIQKASNVDIQAVRTEQDEVDIKAVDNDSEVDIKAI